MTKCEVVVRISILINNILSVNGFQVNGIRFQRKDESFWAGQVGAESEAVRPIIFTQSLHSLVMFFTFHL